MKIQKPKSFLSLGFCLVVVLAWFAPWWLSGKNLAPLDLLNGMMSPWRQSSGTTFAKNHIVSDGVDQYLVYRLIAEKSYREEGWLGWSSLTYGGTAQYANTMALYYDWTMQLHRWCRFWTAWHLGLMGQVWLAAWGMWLFLRGRSIGEVWACCGALAYAANSQFVTWIYHRWALGAFCWVPWILWAIDGHRHGKRLCWALVPVFLGMAFLGGTLQHAALVVLAVAGMWAEEAVMMAGRDGNSKRRFGAWVLRHFGMSDREKRTQAGESTDPSISTESPKRQNAEVQSFSAVGQWPLLGCYLAWGLLGVGLAAMMFLPCADAFVTSNRLGIHMGMHGNAGNGIYPEGWLQPLFNLAAYPLQVFPSILGRCDSLDVLKLFKSELFYVAYFGSLPVIIAFLAPWRKDCPPLARILIGLGLLLPLTPMVRVLYQRLLLLFILGGILAFAHFMESATRETRLKVCRIAGVLMGLGVIGWTALSVLLCAQPGLLDRLRAGILCKSEGSSFGFFSEWMAGRVDRFIHDLSIWSPQQLLPLLLLGAALGGLRATASLQVGWRRKGAWLVALAVIAEVSLFGSRWIVWTDPAREPLFSATPETKSLQDLVGHNGRVTTLIHPTGHMACTPFIPNTLAPYGIATICGYDSIVPNGMLLPNESAGDAGKLGRLGVSHLLTWPGNPDVPSAWMPIWASSAMALYENTLKMPRYVGFQTDADKDRFLAGGHPEAIPLEESSGNENRRLLAVPAGIRWIRVAENQDAGWEYREAPSGGWQPAGRTADASMLIGNPQPMRTSLLEMRYNPPLRRLGFILSAASLALLIIGQWMVLRRRNMHRLSSLYPESLTGNRLGATSGF